MKNYRQALRLMAIMFMIQPLIAKSQVLASEGVRINDFRDTEGTLIKLGSEKGVIGTPMLLEGWATGTVKFKSGNTFTDTALNYSLYTHKLYLKRDGKYLELVQPAETFSLSFQSEEGAIIRHQFKSGYPAIDDHNENTYYEVFYEGKNIQLVSWLQKKVIEPLTYGGPAEKVYSLEQRMYIYKADEKKMIPLSSYSTNALKKAVPYYSDHITAYSTSHKVNFKNKEQFIELLSYLDAGR